MTLLPALVLAAAATASPVHLVLPEGGEAPEGWRGPVHYDLQEAVDAAPDGATIQVAAGDHHLVPLPYDDPTCANCPDPATPVRATRGLLVQGKRIRIRGDSAEESAIHTHAGYGIVLDGCSRAWIEDLTITGGTRDEEGAAADAAVVVRDSRVTLRGTRIVDNLGDPEVVSRVVVGILGIAGREGARIRAEENLIANNSWDAVALYRGAEAVLLRNEILGGEACGGGEVCGGRGVGVGVTWDSRAVLRRNRISGYWKGVGIFVDARVRMRWNVIEGMRTWGIAWWDGGREARPVLEARGNAVYRTGACGISLARAAEGEPAPGALLGNAVVATGQDPRYDGDDTYCRQQAIARHATPAGFVVAGNVLGGNREPGDRPGRDDLPALELRRRLRPLCRRFAADPLLSRSDFAREACAR